LGILRVDTPRTQMASGFLSKVDEVTMGNLSLRCANRFASIGLTALDGQPLRRSRRMLLVAVGNARNTGQKSGQRVLEDGGQAPVLAEPVKAAMRLAADQPEAVQVYALDPLNGRRLAPLATRVDGGRLTFAIGEPGRTIYYELTRQE